MAWQAFHFVHVVACCRSIILEDCLNATDVAEAQKLTFKHPLIEMSLLGSKGMFQLRTVDWLHIAWRLR